MERLPNRYPKISQSHKVPLYKGLSLFYPKLRKDFGKLHKAHQTHSSCKTYFVLVSTSSYIEDAKIERMENFMNLSVGLNKIFKLDYMGQMIYLHNRKRAIQPDFCVLSWEIK